jgi:broad specificity phosphatase PhoE
LPDVVREAGSRKHNIVASHGGFIRRVARLLSTHGIRGAREASTHLNGSPTRTNNLFVLRLIYDTFTVYLVRHCARQYQKQPGWMNKLNPRGGEYTTPDPGCIVSRNNRMWGTVKLHAHLRAVIGVHERIAFFSSIMNRALQTAASIKQELTESAARGVRSDMASDPIRVVPFCREGGNILNSIGMDVLNRPGDASINAARRRGITGTGVF